MYVISLSAATSTLIATIIRDQPYVSLYQNYFFKVRNEEIAQDAFLGVQDTSPSIADYQLFVVTGSTVALPKGDYPYKLYTASGATQADIIYTNILEQGTIRIQS